MRPKDFWRLTPWEFWLLCDVHRPAKWYGKMSEAEVEAIYAEAYGDPDE